MIQLDDETSSQLEVQDVSWNRWKSVTDMGENYTTPYVSHIAKKLLPRSSDIEHKRTDLITIEQEMLEKQKCQKCLSEIYLI